MTTFMLVHGAWHGAWAWETVGDLLHADGHTVITPALAGALDGPAATRGTGLRTHSDAIAALLREQPAPVTLVGHSYAGLVVGQAAAEVPTAVEELVLLDGWIGPAGSSLYDLAPAWFATTCDSAAVQRGDGWLVPVPPSAMFGITDPEQDAWLQQRLRPHPLATFIDPAGKVASAADTSVRALVTTIGVTMPFAELAAAANYPIQHLTTVHNAMITAPDQVAAALTSV